MTAGALLLLFVGWQLWWTDVVADQEQSTVVASLEQRYGESGPHGSGPVVPAIEGEVFGIIRVPRFGAAFARPLVEGTTRTALTHGVGHYVTTALPGEIGNFALAGHRTTWAKPFNRIDTLRPGDLIVIETATDYFVYEVARTEIVSRVGVLLHSTPFRDLVSLYATLGSS